MPGGEERPSTAAIDTNNDGQISYKELEAGFGQLDTNKDGKLQASEIEEVRLQKPDHRVSHYHFHHQAQPLYCGENLEPSPFRRPKKTNASFK